MSKVYQCGSGQGLHAWFCKLSIPYALLLVSRFGPELFATPACLAQVQNSPCSGETRDLLFTEADEQTAPLPC